MASRYVQNRILSGIATFGAVAIVSSVTSAVPSDTQIYDLPAQPLGDALRAVSLASHRDILVSTDLVDGRTAPPLKGRFASERAISILLASSGLHARREGSGFVIASATEGAVGDAPRPAEDIVVTGTRIRGAPVASSVIRITRDEAVNAGQATLGDIVRSIPQSFGGGQNPGIGFNVPAGNGVDVGGGSSINLRGLGSDATLTLLNGHRLAYSGSRQSVDVSTIPLGILDRIEIVADGASALYGSDAVGGVANLILRRDMTGIESRARIGTATDGGDFEQQYGVTTGGRWRGGGVIAAYEFNRTTAIDASQRDYAAHRSTGFRLLPAAHNNNVVINAHQALGDFEFTMQGLYNIRSTLFIYPQNAVGDLAISRSEQTTDERAFAIAPALSTTVGATRRVELSGSFADDRVDYRNVLVTPAASTQLTAGCYCNRTAAVELSSDGRLFHLASGWAKLALGAGYRSAALRSDRGAGNFQNFDRTLGSSYGYAELSLPLIGPGRQMESRPRLNFNAAVRYERYRAIGSVATPKFGIIWSPSPSIELKASWGRSFRAPTLQQRYQPTILTLYSAAGLGVSGYPAGSTVLYQIGGNALLRPEHASSWSISTDIHPVPLPGLSIQLSYFSTTYVDRIVAPIGSVSQALFSPLYAAQVTRSPSAALVSAAVANAGFFQTSGGAVYDPTKVVAFVDNSNVNAGRQPLHGVDMLVSYRADLAALGELNLSGNASYLVSSRQINVDQPIIPLSGVLFNPPKWRARGSVGWQRDRLAITSTISYTGGLRDIRSATTLRIPDQATVDLALRYRLADSAPRVLHGLDLIVAVQDLLNAIPPPIVTGPVTDTPYDSTNYSPVSRFVSFTVAKKW